MGNFEDITETGAQTYKDLQEQNNGTAGSSSTTPAMPYGFEEMAAQDYAPSAYNPSLVGTQEAQSRLFNPLQGDYWGNSRYDEQSATDEEMFNLGDVRANNQPWYAKLGAGIAKGVVLAGTTMIDGSIGLAAGLVQGILNLADDDENTGFWQGLWDNPISNALKEIEQEAEKVLPNYYTSRELMNEESGKWYRNIFTANFWGDKFIKNLGFTAGAILPGIGAARVAGGVAKAILGATKLRKTVNGLRSISKVSNTMAKGIGAIASAGNEARVEARNNSEDWARGMYAELNGPYKEFLQQRGLAYYENPDGTISISTSDIDSLPPDVRSQMDQYDEALAKIDQNAASMGNVDMALNMPILLASNLLQFGKAFTRGFKPQRHLINLTKKSGGSSFTDVPVYAAKLSKKGIAAHAIGNSLSEGSEEMLQTVASDASGNYYSADTWNFVNKRIDPEAEDQTIDFMKAFGNALTSNLTSGQSWEEFAIGALTGALGMPSIGTKVDSKTGNTKKGIVWEGGIYGAIRDGVQERGEQQAMADRINQRLADPKFREMYQGMIRHFALQNDMNAAIDANDEKAFKDSEAAQFISDIMMFDNIGAIDDLKTMFSGEMPSSDEEIQELIESTTKTQTNPETGAETFVGPFIDEHGNPLSNDKIVDILSRNKKAALQAIDDYQQIINDIKVGDFGDAAEDIYKDSHGNISAEKVEEVRKKAESLSDSQVEELAFLKMMAKDGHTRVSSMHSDVVVPTFQKVLSTYTQAADDIQKKLNRARKKSKKEELQKQLDELRSVESFLSEVTNTQAADIETYLNTHKEALQDLFNILGHYSGTSVESSERTNALNTLRDINRVLKSITKYNEKIKEYLSNPKKLEESINRAREAAQKTADNKKTAPIKERINKARSLSELQNIIREEAEKDRGNTEKALLDLKETGSEDIKNLIAEYEKFNSVANSTERLLAGIENQQEREDAQGLWRQHKSSAKSSRELVDTESASFNSDEFLYDQEEDDDLREKRFGAAKERVAYALHQIAQDERYSSLFEDPEEKVKEEEIPENNLGGESTGASEVTPTVPVNTEPAASSEETKEEEEEKKTPETIEMTGSEASTSTPIGSINASKSESSSVDEENAANNERNAKNTEKLQGAPKKGGKRRYWFNNISRTQHEGKKVVSTKEAIPVLKTLWDYLKDHNAFSYVERGNLHVGDEVTFMIDPELNKKLSEGGKNYDAILIVKMLEDGTPQVVGSLQLSDSFTSSTVGQKTLVDKIRKEWEETEDKSKEKIFTQYTTKVSQLMIGGIQYGEEERSLGDDALYGPEAKVNGKRMIPKLAIQKDLEVALPYGVRSDELEYPVNSTSGAVYLLLPNAAHGYTPVRLFTKRFNKKEINNADAENTPIMKKVMKCLDELVNANSTEAMGDAAVRLGNLVYLRDVFIGFAKKKGSEETFIKVEVKEKDASGNYLYEERNGVKYEKTKTIWISKSLDPAAQKQKLYEALLSLNRPFQVSTADLSNTSVITELIDSGILTTNAILHRDNEEAPFTVEGSWFIMDPIDDGGNSIKAEGVPENKPIITSTPQAAENENNPVGGTETVDNSVTVTAYLGEKESKEYTLKEDGTVLYEGKAVPEDVAIVIRSLNYINTAFSSTAKEENGYKVIKNPSGKVVMIQVGTLFYNPESKVVFDHWKQEFVPASDKRYSQAVEGWNTYNGNSAPIKSEIQADLEEAQADNSIPGIQAKLSGALLTAEFGSIEDWNEVLASAEKEYGVDLSEYNSNATQENIDKIIEKISAATLEESPSESSSEEQAALDDLRDLGITLSSDRVGQGTLNDILVEPLDASKEMSMQDLEDIISQSPKYKALYEKLKELNLFTEMTTRGLKIYNAKLTDGTYGAALESGHSLIVLDMEKLEDDEDAAQTALHELLHIVVNDAYNVNPGFRDKIDSLLEKAREHPSIRFEHQLEDAYEFMTGAFTNPSFMRWLNHIEYKQENKSFIRTLFDSIADAIREFLGLDAKYNSLLKEVMNTTLEGATEYAKVLNNGDFSTSDNRITRSVKPVQSPELDAEDYQELENLGITQEMLKSQPDFIQDYVKTCLGI